MTIRDWPDGERPREKLVARGAGALSDAELLAIFLGSGRRGMDAVQLGRALLTQHKGIKGLLENPAARTDVGPVAWCRLQAGMELGRRYLESELVQGQSLEDPAHCARYLKSQLYRYPYEVFACLFLDNRHRVLGFEELFRGSIANTEVHPRAVVRRCMSHNAAAVIFAHTPPAGVDEPSSSDRVITQRLKEALALIDVRVLDHFVIGDGAPTSMALRGWV